MQNWVGGNAPHINNNFFSFWVLMLLLTFVEKNLFIFWSFLYNVGDPALTPWKIPTPFGKYLNRNSFTRKEPSYWENSPRLFHCSWKLLHENFFRTVPIGIFCLSKLWFEKDFKFLIDLRIMLKIPFSVEKLLLQKIPSEEFYSY